jgi:hypothetical protein
MTDQKPWYFEERAEQLAIMLLTRLEGVQVSRMGADPGVDLLVTIDSQHSAGRLFGVEVKATKKMSSLVNSNGILKRDLATRLEKATKHYTFPVGVLIVEVISDAARFGWILKPEAGQAIYTGNIHTQVATKEVMRRSLEEVKRWYQRRAAGT